MSLFARFSLWRAKRRHARRQRFIKRQRTVYTWPRDDSRNWSEALMRSLRK